MYELIRRLLTEAAALADLAFLKPSEPSVIIEEAEKVAKSWSQSWLGYQADVYYRDLNPPPPGAVFSKEWGLMERVGRLGSTGEWGVVDRDQLLAHIYERAGAPDLDRLKQKCADASRELGERTSTILSIIAANRLSDMDGYCSQLCQGISDIQPFSAAEVIKFLSPSGQQMSRDSNAINAGLWTPAHIEAYAVALSLISPFEKAEELGLQVKGTSKNPESRQSRNVINIAATGLTLSRWSGMGNLSR